MNEFDVIATYFNRGQVASETILVPNGDDCAVIAPGNEPLAISVDTCIEGVHFPKNSKAKWVAKRALRTALSDLCAMGATPKYVTMALTLPSIKPKWLKAFSKSLYKDLAYFDCDLLGGDTTQGDTLSISFTVMGECPTPITRSGAQVGDHIYVTNTLGNGAAALYYLQHQLDAHLYSDDDTSVLKAREKYARRHFFKPSLTFGLSQTILPFATSAIDISDGLIADLTHICHQSGEKNGESGGETSGESGVSAALNLNALPFSKQARQLAKQKADNTLLGMAPWLEDDISAAQKTLLTWALTGGDDYELCFTAPESAVDALDASVKQHLTNIGVIKAKADLPVSLTLNGHPVALASAGYAHFN